MLNKIKPDLFLSPDGLLSLGWHGPQYGVIHDINFVHIPKDLKWSNRTYYNYFIPRYAHKAARLGTVSEYSKQDIMTTFGIPGSKIDVLYCGINDFFGPVSEQVKQETRARYTNGAGYFIFVGTLHPRKNILRLLQAFEIFKETTGSDMKLVLVGREMYRTGDMYTFRDEMKFRNDVLFPGHLPDEELKKVFASASCLAFVPYFEGFGIPLVEAMQCDVPIIVSNVTSLPEVAGDAGLLVDPFDVDAIAGAMTKIYREPSLRQELVIKGRRRRTLFSWERTAGLLWDSVARVL